VGVVRVTWPATKTKLHLQRYVRVICRHSVTDIQCCDALQQQYTRCHKQPTSPRNKHTARMSCSLPTYEGVDIWLRDSVQLHVAFQVFLHRDVWPQWILLWTEAKLAKEVCVVRPYVLSCNSHLHNIQQKWLNSAAMTCNEIIFSPLINWVLGD